MFDIITIGSATRDVFVVSNQFYQIKSKKIPSGVGECVALGSKIDVDQLVLTTGGGATNAAATFASLGFQTAAITRIGNDATGKDVVEDLSRFGVSTLFVRMVKNGQTGFSILLTMPDGERTVLTFRGVSSTFTQNDIYWAGFQQTKWIYLTSLGGNMSLCKKIIEQAKKQEVRIAWNPGKKELEGGIKVFESLLPLIDVLMMNKEEAQLLTNKKSIQDMFHLLHNDGLIRLITDGTNGSYVWQDQWMAHASTTGAKAISRTGAGDAFGSGFVSGFMKTENIKQAMAIGTLNAEAVIQKHGAKNGLLKKWPSRLALVKINITK